VEAAIQTQNTHNLVERKARVAREGKKRPKKHYPKRKSGEGKKKKKRGSGWSRDCKDLEHKYFYLWEVWSKVPVEPKLNPPPPPHPQETKKERRGVCHNVALPFTLKCNVF
jgi:hypothetical protein